MSPRLRLVPLSASDVVAMPVVFLLKLGLLMLRGDGTELHSVAFATESIDW